MRITTRSLSSLLLLAAIATSSTAQDKAADAPKPKPAELKVVSDEEKAAKADPQASWKKLMARKVEIFTHLQQLKKDFAKAEGREAKVKARDEFTDLIRQFEVGVFPQMQDLAETIFTANPTELDAGEIVMQKAYNENQYEKSGDVAAKLLAANFKSKSVLSTAGASQYALHNFEEAVRLLTEAQSSNKLDPQFDAVLGNATKYVEFGKAEMEIRAKEEKLEGDNALPQVVLETEKGKIIIELFEDHAPNTVANFISLVEGKKYDGVKFHRVENGFMAQGGDPNTLNDDPSDDGHGGPGYTIKCECYAPHTPRMHFRGSLSMAHAGKDSGGSQFFITHLPTAWLNPATEPRMRGHTVFGRVIEGLELSGALRRGDKIIKAEVLRTRPHEYKPVTTPDPVEKPADEDKSAKKPEKTDESKKPVEGEAKKEEVKKDEVKKDDTPKAEPKKDEAKQEVPKKEEKPADAK